MRCRRSASVIAATYWKPDGSSPAVHARPCCTTMRCVTHTSAVARPQQVPHEAVHERSFAVSTDSAVPRNARQVGQRLPRLEDRRHLAGRGNFVADVRLPGMRDVAFLRSQVAHGDLDGVALTDGIEADAVWTAERLAPVVHPVHAMLKRPNYRGADFPIFATDRVRYVGALIAAVISYSRALAADTARHLVPNIDARGPHRSV